MCLHFVVVFCNVLLLLVKTIKNLHHKVLYFDFLWCAFFGNGKMCDCMNIISE